MRPTLALALALAIGPTGVRAASSEMPSMRVRMPPSLTELVLRRAIGGADRRLARPECQRLFTDFTDTKGRPLQDRLDTLGLSGQRFLEHVGFYEGAGHDRCASGNVLAFTQPGSLAVRVCPQIARHGPDQAEVVVLHEMLHSLGLAENPPTSLEITRRVEARCGQAN